MRCKEDFGRRRMRKLSWCWRIPFQFDEREDANLTCRLFILLAIYFFRVLHLHADSLRNSGVFYVPVIVILSVHSLDNTSRLWYFSLYQWSLIISWNASISLDNFTNIIKFFCTTNDLIMNSSFYLTKSSVNANFLYSVDSLYCSY